MQAALTTCCAKWEALNSNEREKLQCWRNTAPLFDAEN